MLIAPDEPNAIQLPETTEPIALLATLSGVAGAPISPSISPKIHTSHSTEIPILFAVFLLQNTFHSIIYWTVIDEAGALSTGLTNACRTVTVFTSSAVLFCDSMATQCVTLNKAIGALIVFCGVLLYTLDTSVRTEKHGDVVATLPIFKTSPPLPPDLSQKTV